MGISTVQIRQALATAAAAISADWHQSNFVYDSFPRTESQSLAHLSFAIGALRTQFADRQRRGREIPSRTTFGIRWLHNLRQDEQLADEDAALTAEIALIAALRAVTVAPVRMVSVAIRTTVGDGTYFLGELHAEVDHLFPTS